jgi:hypothetical protein
MIYNYCLRMGCLITKTYNKTEDILHINKNVNDNTDIDTDIFVTEITRNDVRRHINRTTELEYRDIIIDDVLRIVNDGYKYVDRGLDKEYRIPEDISTSIAYAYYDVNGYET